MTTAPATPAMRTLFTLLLSMLATAAWAQQPEATPTSEPAAAAVEAAPAAPATATDPARDLVEPAALISEDRQDLLSRGAEIEDLLKRALALNNGLIEAWFDLAILADVQGKPTEARQHLDKVFQLDPNYANGRALRGTWMLREGMAAEARAEFDAALAADPYNPIANNALAEEALGAGRFDEAIRFARLSLLIDSDNMNSYSVIAEAYRRQEQTNLAKLVCYNALSMNPKAALIYNTLGLIFLSEDEVKDAIVQFEKAVEFRPDFIEARLNLGAIMLNYNDFSGALGHFEAVIAKDPDNVDALLSKAVAQRGLARFDEAGAGYERVLTLKPNHEGALYNRCILYQEYLQDYDKALGFCQQMLASISRGHPDFKEMTDRVAGIEQTIAIMKQMELEKQQEKLSPPEPETPPTESGADAAVDTASAPEAGTDAGAGAATTPASDGENQNGPEGSK